MSTWLYCVCGQPVLKADDDGMFWEETEVVCPRCGIESRVSVDDGYACLSTDETVKDVGQPRCDGSGRECGAEAFVGSPCLWTCDRFNKEKKMKATQYEHRINDCLLIKIEPNGMAEAEDDSDAWEWKLWWYPEPTRTEEPPRTIRFQKGHPSKHELAWGRDADPDKACASALKWARTNVLCEGDEG